jgi:hypothetical protein
MNWHFRDSYREPPHEPFIKILTITPGQREQCSAAKMDGSGSFGLLRISHWRGTLILDLQELPEGRISRLKTLSPRQKVWAILRSFAFRREV